MSYSSTSILLVERWVRKLGPFADGTRKYEVETELGEA